MVFMGRSVCISNVIILEGLQEQRWLILILLLLPFVMGVLGNCDKN